MDATRYFLVYIFKGATMYFFVYIFKGAITYSALLKKMLYDIENSLALNGFQTKKNNTHRPSQNITCQWLVMGDRIIL